MALTGEGASDPFTHPHLAGARGYMFISVSVHNKMPIINYGTTLNIINSQLELLENAVTFNAPPVANFVCLTDSIKPNRV